MEIDWLAIYSNEEELLRLIGDAVAETPSSVIESGLGMYTWRLVDAELLALLRSAVDEPSSRRIPVSHTVGAAPPVRTPLTYFSRSYRVGKGRSNT